MPRKSAQPITIDANAPPEPKIGDSLYYCGQGMFSRQWKAVTIIGDTRLSWLIYNAHGPQLKVAKDTLQLRSSGLIERFYTAAGMADKIWRDEHFHKITIALNHAPVPLLKEVANLLHVSLSSVRK